MKKDYNYCIIGAGVVGLSIAQELVKQGITKIVILEKEKDVGLHASGRNSGVLHAGIYYPADSLKAQFCLAGNHAWKDFCKTYSLPIRETGKFLVCRNTHDVEGLHRIYQQAMDNGAKVSLVSVSDLAQKEPLAKTTELALWSPETAVVDSKAILQCLKAQLEDSGHVTFLMNTPVKAVLEDGVFDTSAGTITCDRWVNAAGAYSDQIAHQVGVGLSYRFLPFKGCYQRLVDHKSTQISAHIYPVPDLKLPFLGVHFTKSVTGDTYVGPTAIPAFGPENYGFFDGLSLKSLDILYSDAMMLLHNSKFRRLAMTEPKHYWNHFFVKEAQSLTTGISAADIVTCSKVGIRPQLVHWETKALEMDFVVEQAGKGVHILNAISPAWTSAPAFAAYVVGTYLS